MNLIDGNQIARDVLDELKLRVSTFNGEKPCVIFVRVGDDPASISYVKKKEKTAQEQHEALCLGHDLIISICCLVRWES